MVPRKDEEQKTLDDWREMLKALAFVAVETILFLIAWTIAPV